MLQAVKNFTAQSFKRDVTTVLVPLIILIASIFRIGIHGNPALSIATNDTDSYVESSRVPLFSSEMMTGRRLLSTNLIYKILEPKEGYEILVNGSVETRRRQIQPGFDRIVLLQLFLSILGWGFLALTVSEYIKNPIMKVLAAVILLLFGFTPQIADWDSILMSESLGFSLFAIQLAIMIRIAFKIYSQEDTNLSFWVFTWSVIFCVWTFLRDTNLFASLVTAGLIGVLFFLARFRKNKRLHGLVVFITAIFLIGLFTSSKSTRSLVQMVNIYKDDLLRSEASVNTLQELGMPTPPYSADYNQWFEENAATTLIKFMLIHPGYPLRKISKDFSLSFTEIKQTYFHAPEQYLSREPLMQIGNALHPENTTPFLMDVLLLIGLIVLSARNGNSSSLPWLWLAFWLFLAATLTLIPTILGDTWALNRHALFSTTIYRLFMWMFLIIVMDLAVEPASQPLNPPSQSQIEA
jgi:hypothetical protein